MKVNFLIRYRTKFGQGLSITGNISALGSNDMNKAMPMSYLSGEFWQASVEINPQELESIQYRYIFHFENGEKILDGELERIIYLKDFSSDISVVDTWCYAGSYEQAFLTAPFQNIYFKKHFPYRQRAPKIRTHIFKVKAPLLKENECVCLLGSFQNWEVKHPVLLEKSGNWWQAGIDLSDAHSIIAYKYGIYDLSNKKFIRWEDGENRIVSIMYSEKQPVVLHDGFVYLPGNTWKGAGVSIPVFSLRTNSSAGIGEFSDIKLLADWAHATGLKLIQVLPVNDTIANFTYKDSYPYAAISAFALHPAYINLQKVAGKKHAKIVSAYAKQIDKLNALDEIDYESVINLKLKVLRKLYEALSDSFIEEKDFQDFFEDNQHWLKPYAAFCVFRDKYDTSDFQKWKTNASFRASKIEQICTPGSKQFSEIAFWFFVQYHLHSQLREAVSYAHEKGIAIKGDIPIGVYRFGCDAWMTPELYNMDMQAGAPPDHFAVNGQNWGFPTYNWNKMQENGFNWWHQRFHQMSYYFDAFRIDHILGFFRIWSIPVHALEGILGYFSPALPVHISEFTNRGIYFDYDRFCQPFITRDILIHLFKGKAAYVADKFLIQQENGNFSLKEEFNTQQKIAEFFARADKNEHKQHLKDGLFNLVSNVLLFEQEGSDGQAFHFRISMPDTASFHHLDNHTKHHMYELYVNYFYHRQDEFWKKEALRKLPALKEATSMLICGEDLGMVPHCVPEVMKDLGILSLEIQRMPKNPHTEFFHPKDAPYLSVVTPSTHDMSTIRGWWEESEDRTQRFYNTILGEHGQAPSICNSHINRKIILQHLHSPAMWSIFQLQDLLSNSDRLCRPDPLDERINNPADPDHYWNYRMHLTLETLIAEDNFNNELGEMIKQSGRE